MKMDTRRYVITTLISRQVDSIFRRWLCPLCGIRAIKPNNCKALLAQSIELCPCPRNQETLLVWKQHGEIPAGTDHQSAIYESFAEITEDLPGFTACSDFELRDHLLHLSKLH
jgi:hypothetical protein